LVRRGGEGTEERLEAEDLKLARDSEGLGRCTPFVDAVERVPYVVGRRNEEEVSAMKRKQDEEKRRTCGSYSDEILDTLSHSTDDSFE
jgi:hypothetical protein